MSVEALWKLFDRWVQSGKVLAVGVSNWPVWRIAQASETAMHRGWPKLAVSSPKYNLLTRGIELDQVPCALHYGISLVPYQPFQGGLLTGKYRSGQAPPQGSRAAEKPNWMPAALDEVLDKVEVLRDRM